MLHLWIKQRVHSKGETLGPSVQSSEAPLHDIFLTWGLEIILSKKDGFPPPKEIFFALAEMSFECTCRKIDKGQLGDNW